MSHRRPRPLCCALLWLSIAAVLVCPLRNALADGGQNLQPELFLFKEETVSAAVKWPQPTREAPTSVTVISREELRRFGYRTLGEALRTVPGFYTSGDRNYTYLGVRGFQRPGDFSDRVLLLVNGHTLNDDIYQHAPVGEDFPVDLEAIERIEVVRGPGSALYGGNAFFAVINVVTLAPADAPGIQARAETGSFSRKRGQASFGYTSPSGLDVFASGSVLDTDGQEELFYPAYNTPAFNNGVAEDGDAERALKLFLQARYGHFSLQADASGRQQHIPTGAFGSTFNDPGSKTLDQRGFVEARYGSEVWRDLTVDARGYYDYLRKHDTLIFGTGNERTKNETEASSDWVGTELRARSTTLRQQTITGGVEYSYHPGARQQNFDLPSHAQYLNSLRSFNNVGVYVQDEVRLLSSLTVIAGGRFDSQYGSIDEWSPRVAAVWRPQEQTAVKLLYGTAFRPPSLFESYGSVNQDTFRRLAAPNLNAERITTYEAAVEQDLWSARATVAVFHDDIHNLINTVSVATTDGVPTTQDQNNESVRANGVETSLRVPLPQRMALRSTYSFQVTRSPGDRRLSNSPEHQGNVALLFTLPLGIEGGTELLVVAPRDTLEGGQVETVTLLNLNLLYRLPRYNITLMTGFYNLLDRMYPDPGGPQHLQDALPQDGFTFRVQLGYGF